METTQPRGQRTRWRTRQAVVKLPAPVRGFSLGLYRDVLVHKKSDSDFLLFKAVRPSSPSMQRRGQVI